MTLDKARKEITNDFNTERTQNENISALYAAQMMRLYNQTQKKDYVLKNHDTILSYDTNDKTMNQLYKYEPLDISNNEYYRIIKTHIGSAIRALYQYTAYKTAYDRAYYMVRCVSKIKNDILSQDDEKENDDRDDNKYEDEPKDVKHTEESEVAEDKENEDKEEVEDSECEEEESHDRKNRFDR